MDLAGLSNQRLTRRGTQIGRRIRIVNRDESVGTVYVRHIPDPNISKSSFARNTQQQRAQPIRPSARAGHCVRAFAPRRNFKHHGIRSGSSVPIHARSA